MPFNTTTSSSRPSTISVREGFVLKTQNTESSFKTGGVPENIEKMPLVKEEDLLCSRLCQHWIHLHCKEWIHEGWRRAEYTQCSD
ncbi:hypothetical protein AAFF_G00102270 [Aldrovandia affinis]|uniref:Uncharacterized protein n=1 Tax=Aldrovandia affinis TaxID=143900 RepID=A0AAD7RX52_9TELE|nr:hypothetical protein AAFF_G00102270 [Aldrovandia affinis]